MIRQRSITIGVLLFVIAGLIATVGFFALQIPAQSRYVQLRQDVLKATLSSAPIDDEAEEFLDSVRESWQLHSQESPDSVFAEISSITGLEESTVGVVSLYTHEIPEYSFFDFSRNERESLMAATMAVALPISVDGRVYVGDGVAYISANENCVEVFEDTEEGLTRSLYTKPTDGESTPLPK